MVPKKTKTLPWSRGHLTLRHLEKWCRETLDTSESVENTNIKKIVRWSDHMPYLSSVPFIFCYFSGYTLSFGWTSPIRTISIWLSRKKNFPKALVTKYFGTVIIRKKVGRFRRKHPCSSPILIKLQGTHIQPCWNGTLT